MFSSSKTRHSKVEHGYIVSYIQGRDGEEGNRDGNAGGLEMNRL